MSSGARRMLIVAAVLPLAGLVGAAPEQGGVLGSLLPAPPSSTQPVEPRPVSRSEGIVGSLLKPATPSRKITDHDRFEAERAAYGTQPHCEKVRRRWVLASTLGTGLVAGATGAVIHGLGSKDFGHANVYGLLGLEVAAGMILGYQLGAALGPDCHEPDWDTVGRSPEDRFEAARLRYDDCVFQRRVAMAGWTGFSALVTGLIVSGAVRSVAHTPATYRWGDLGAVVAGVGVGALFGWPAGANRAPHCTGPPRLEDLPAATPAPTADMTGATVPAVMAPSSVPSGTVNP